MSGLPSIRQLQYFLALEEHEHFGRAAAACFVSQSAFSHAIRELEQTLGLRLVDRNNRSVTITNAGRDIAVQARLALQDVKSLVELARTHSNPLSGPLVMGAIPTIAPFLLPRVMPKLRELHPELQLYLREAKTETICAGLQDGSLDVIVLALPWEMHNARVMHLFNDNFHLACHPRTKLIDPDNFSLNRLSARSVMLLEDGHCLRDHTLSACKIVSQDTINRFSASSLMTLLEMVKADLGITFVPEIALDAGVIDANDIRTLPLKPPSSREIALAWRADSARGEEFEQLGEIIRAVAAPPPPKS
ncbi:MAG: LysR substrate-binding domain-containing protein [Gammaproteobacteria bacterium]|jgi:LysR family hydrogen peroxide-inducible transcriptional activator|nr:LysR substrate-binding domain-containing protein [Gammaproteobacteria bacterium]